MYFVVAPLQFFVGDYAGKQLPAEQPAKLAAIEGFWDTKAAQDFHIVAWPDRARQGNDWEISLPKLGSWITTGDANATLRGLKSFPRADQPPSFLVFWSFRTMVGLGLAMIGLGLWGAWLWWRRALEKTQLFLRATILMGPAGFVAVIAGWITAEVGRQPWVVYGLMRTSAGVSPVTAREVSASLIGFLVVYAIIFTAGGALHAAADGAGAHRGDRVLARCTRARHGARRGSRRTVAQGARAVSLDLPLIWAGVIAFAVLLYVLLDGFDLGVGILFAFAKHAGRPRRDDGEHRALLGRQRDLAGAGRRRSLRGLPRRLCDAAAGLLPADLPDAAGADPARRRLRVPPPRTAPRQARSGPSSSAPARSPPLRRKGWCWAASCTA